MVVSLAPLLLERHVYCPAGELKGDASSCAENLTTPEEHCIVGERFEHQRAALAPVGMGVDRRVEAPLDLNEYCCELITLPGSIKE